MTLLSEAVDRLTALLESSPAPLSRVQQEVVDVIENAHRATGQDLEDALQRMKIFITKMGIVPASFVALACGALVEQGTHPESVGDVIVQRARHAIKMASTFALSCQDLARHDSAPEIDPENIDACIQRYSEELIKIGSEEGKAWFMLSQICTAALAVLMRLPYMREALQNDPEFMADLEKGLALFPEQLDCLYELFLLLDEEMIVLHPALQRGYRIHIRGIHDNFQLHTLLADALIGDPQQGWLPGERPDPRVVAAAKDGAFPRPGEDADNDFPAAKGVFNLWNWQGLQADGTLYETPGDQSKLRKHWIWNEGKPQDIALFEGIRIILLGPPPYDRTWNPGRYFPGLPGELKVLEKLSDAQIRDWLTRISAAVKLSGQLS